LKSALSSNGFDTNEAFSIIGDEQLPEIYEAVNEYVRQLDKADMTPAKAAIIAEVSKLNQTLQTFRIPLGHKNLIRSLRNQHAAITQQLTGSSEQRLTPLARQRKSEQPNGAIMAKWFALIRSAVETIVPVELRNDLREESIEFSNDTWVWKCTFCSKSYVLQLNEYGQCKTSNIRQHLKKFHATLPVEMLLVPLPALSSSSETSEPSSSSVTPAPSSSSVTPAPADSNSQNTPKKKKKKNQLE